MNNPTVTARELLRNQNEVIKRIKKSGQPHILINRDEPQIALIPLSQLNELTMIKRKKAFEELDNLVSKIKTEQNNITIPKDLSTNHNKYFVES